ncbi:hypothetical protein, partial [Streptomyces decoyicus]
AETVIEAWYQSFGGSSIDVPLGTVAALALLRRRPERPARHPALLAAAPERDRGDGGAGAVPVGAVDAWRRLTASAGAHPGHPAVAVP